jgi:hypothetical protein
MELDMAIWLNHYHGDGRVVDISVVDAYSRVEVCMSIFFEGPEKATRGG